MNSMTAYANVYKEKKDQTLQIIMRALNFKYLDIVIHNLPQEKLLLEEKIKKEIKKKIYRGKVEVYIFMKRPAERKIHIEEKTVANYVSQIRKLAKKYNLKADLNIGDILNLPQVIFSEDKRQGEDNLILPAVKESVEKLYAFRKKEGRIIKHEMLKNLKKLEANVNEMKKYKPSVSKETNGKEDIDEEISLSAFYINKLKNKIKSKSMMPKGKSIDFFTQEILRELNASSSKTKRKNLALLIVEAKNYLERVREQAQNIE
jgi:uncharacterized protein (TIGR00255 family)